MGRWLSGAAQTSEPQLASVDCAKTSADSNLVASTSPSASSVVLGVEDIPSPVVPASEGCGRLGVDGRGLVPRRSVKAARKRYYTVSAGPDHLLGVWYASWADLCLRLPTGKLFGSGCRVHGFDSFAEAESKWFEKWTSSPPKQRQWPQ